jgi:hypothetical protein
MIIKSTEILVLCFSLIIHSGVYFSLNDAVNFKNYIAVVIDE